MRAELLVFLSLMMNYWLKKQSLTIDSQVTGSDLPYGSMILAKLWLFLTISSAIDLLKLSHSFVISVYELIHFDRKYIKHEL